MKRSTSLLLLFVFCFLSLFYSGEGIAGTLQDVKRRGKLIAGVKTDYPPLGFLDKKGINKGFDIDIAKAISKELFGNEEAIQFVPVMSGNRIAFLTSRKIDIIVATFTITEERKREVDFSSPYFITGQLILVRGDSKITKYEDLAGKKVATIRGSTGDIAIEELVPTAERVKFERNFEALQALKEHRVEGFVQDFILLFDLLQKNPGLKMANLQPFRPAQYGLAVRKGDKEWLDFISAASRGAHRALRPDRRRAWRQGHEERILGAAQPLVSHSQEPQGALLAAEHRGAARRGEGARAQHADQRGRDPLPHRAGRGAGGRPIGDDAVEGIAR